MRDNLHAGPAPYKRRLIFWTLLLVGLFARLQWAANFRAPLRDDPLEYDRLARVMLATGCFGLDGPQARWAPLYPAMITTVYAIHGKTQPGLVVWYNIALSVLAGVALYHLGRLAFGPTIGLTGFGVFQFWPNAVMAPSLLASENLYLPLFITAVLCLVIGQIRPAQFWPFITAGLLMGLAALTREVMLAAVAGAALAGLLARGFLGVPRAKWLTAALVAALVVSPWTARNWLRFHHLIPVTTNMGINLYFGNNPSSVIYWVPWDHPFFDPFRGLNDIEIHSKATRMALHHMATHPLDTGIRFFAKIAVLLIPDMWPQAWNEKFMQEAGNHAHWWGAYHFWFYMPALVGSAIYGLLVWLGRRLGDARFPRGNRAQGFIALVLLFFIAAHGLIYAWARYRYPLEMLMILFASAAAWALIDIHRHPAANDLRAD